MSHQYLQLSPESDIRLLRLMPHSDEDAPIKCELFEYSFQESSKRTHLYEALSYVWGSLEPPKVISIDSHSFRVTKNLHTALSNLRDRSIVRVIWVDAVCINQKDNEERAQQIQSMAKIYGHANRVIVYLGEAAQGSGQAIEDIRVAADAGSTNLWISEQSQEAILKLLERPWFRRMWVLQEVALARRILIMCGSAEINGYTFCSGFRALELSYKNNPDLDLPSLIRSVTYLIRGAIFRPKYATSQPGEHSLGELIDMYHTRESTEPNDKVYALLGMTFDGPSAAGLSPDYNVPWKTLLQRLVEFVLCKGAFVEIPGTREIAVIKSKGCILGQVSSVEDDSARYDRQHVEIIFKDTSRSLKYKGEYGTRWTLQASAKPIRRGDLVCLIEGAPKPTIIRTYKDHFAVIIIAVTLRQSGRIESEYFKSQEALASAENLSRDFLLVWNWGKSSRSSQDRAEYEALVDINNLMPEYLKTASNKAARLCDVALVLGDLEDYEEAENRFQQALQSCEGAFGKENLRVLTDMDSLASTGMSQQQWPKAEDMLLQVIETRKRVQGIDHQDTLSSIANLASIYIDQLYSGTRRREEMTSLTDGIRDNGRVKEEDMVQVAMSFGKGLITLLLGLQSDNVPVTKEVVKAAASNENQEAMALLLDNRGDEVQITEEVLKMAASNVDGNKAMALLLDRRGNEVQITDNVVTAAASNEYSGTEVMELLLDRRGSEVQITKKVVIATASNRHSG